MNSASLQRYRDSCNRSFEDLREVHDDHDWDGYWDRVRGYLDRLYAWEEYLKKRDGQAFFNLRNGDIEGQVQGAMIWVRGLVVHHQAEIVDSTLRPIHAFFSTRDGLKPMQLKRSGSDGQLQHVSLFQAVALWPARSALPVGQPERHGRDLLYDRHVAGRRVIEPLAVVQQFVNRVN